MSRVQFSGAWDLGLGFGLWALGLGFGLGVLPIWESSRESSRLRSYHTLWQEGVQDQGGRLAINHHRPTQKT